MKGGDATTAELFFTHVFFKACMLCWLFSVFILPATSCFRLFLESNVHQKATSGRVKCSHKLTTCVNAYSGTCANTLIPVNLVQNFIPVTLTQNSVGNPLGNNNSVWNLGIKPNHCCKSKYGHQEGNLLYQQSSKFFLHGTFMLCLLEIIFSVIKR